MIHNGGKAKFWEFSIKLYHVEKLATRYRNFNLRRIHSVIIHYTIDLYT